MRAVKAKRMRRYFGDTEEKRGYISNGQTVFRNPEKRRVRIAKNILKRERLVNRND